MVRKSNGRSAVAEGRSERRKLARRRAILAAAAEAFREHGIAATGMREIALAADLSPANLYYYFASKDELLYFCQDDSLDRLLEAARDAAKAPPAEALREVIEAHLRCILVELDGALAHLEVDALAPELRARLVAKRDRYEKLVRGIVQAGIRARKFVRCDATLVTRAILGALNWTARWYRPGGPRGPGAIARAYSDYLVRGLEA